jgi:hypothetical protein
MLQFSGRKLCDVWGGRVSKEISFSFATTMAIGMGLANGNHSCPKSSELGLPY